MSAQAGWEPAIGGNASAVIDVRMTTATGTNATSRP
jgi:hypothetical protein